MSDDFDFDSFYAELKADLDSGETPSAEPAPAATPDPMIDELPTPDVELAPAPRPRPQTPPAASLYSQPSESPARDYAPRGMVCPRCGSTDVNVQAVSNVHEKRKKGCLYWAFIGWWWEPLMWLTFGIFKLFHAIFSKKTKTVTTIETHAVCQSCGHRWKVR